MQLQEQEKADQCDAYSLFVYAIRSQVTKEYYLRRLKIFFNFLNLFPNEDMETYEDKKKIVVNIIGNKLKGLYCLLHFKPNEKNWLFFRVKD